MEKMIKAATEFTNMVKNVGSAFKDFVRKDELTFRDVIDEVMTMRKNNAECKSAFVRKEKSNDKFFVVSIIVIDSEENFLDGVKIECNNLDEELIGHFGEMDLIYLK